MLSHSWNRWVKPRKESLSPPVTQAVKQPQFPQPSPQTPQKKLENPPNQTNPNTKRKRKRRKKNWSTCKKKPSHVTQKGSLSTCCLHYDLFATEAPLRNPPRRPSGASYKTAVDKVHYSLHTKQSPIKVRSPIAYYSHYDLLLITNTYY